MERHKDRVRPDVLAVAGDDDACVPAGDRMLVDSNRHVSLATDHVFSLVEVEPAVPDHHLPMRERGARILVDGSGCE